MAFAVKRKETMPATICRLGQNAAKKALKLCEKQDLESIHSARKQIKKLRALLRLVRHEIGGTAFEKNARDLRKAAAHLAASRDAHVRLETLRKVSLRLETEGSESRFVKCQARLKSECRNELARFGKEKHAKAVQRVLCKLKQRFAKLPLKTDGWAAIGPGIKKSYGRVRDAREAAQEDPSTEHLHTWRKRVKDLTCYLQLLEPIWPEQMTALSEQFEKLGEYLGDEHDLQVLREALIRKSAESALEDEIGTLLPLIETQRLELRKITLATAPWLFEQKSSEFCEHLHRYWKAWKNRKTHPPGQNEKARKSYENTLTLA